MRLFSSSVRSRLALWYTLALALPLVAFTVASYLSFSHAVHLRTDAFMADALTVFERELGAERRAGPSPEEVIRRTLQDLRFREVDIVILDELGGVIGTSPHVAAAERDEDAIGPADLRRLVTGPGAAELLTDSSHITTLHQDGRSYRALARSLEQGEPGYRLVGIHPLAEVAALLRPIRVLFFVAIPLIIACAAGGGLFLVRRSFAPVSAMAARAAEISARTLDDRLPAGSEDELAELARVLNDLLDRLQRTFEQQRRFMADASHELRTPVAIVRTEAEVTLSRQGRTEGEYRASLEIVLDAGRRLGRIVEDLFLAARADAGHLSASQQRLRLDELVRGTARTMQPIADERGVRIDLSPLPEAPLRGDADLLNRLLLNLMHNAIKHSPEGGSIEVSLMVGRTTCALDVVDAGPGIPHEASERLFERFVQLDRSRARDERANSPTGGAGLGLSICRRIAELHGGRVELSSSRPGRTVFRAILPLV